MFRIDAVLPICSEHSSSVYVESAEDLDESKSTNTPLGPIYLFLTALACNAMQGGSHVCRLEILVLLSCVCIIWDWGNATKRMCYIVDLYQLHLQIRRLPDELRIQLMCASTAQLLQERPPLTGHLHFCA